MTHPPRFELVPIEKLLIHEEIHDEHVGGLVERIRAKGVVEVPILVARDDYVILDGHHRFAALKALGARRVPAWIVDYHAEEIQLDRWNSGPPLSKDEVLTRGRAGRPFPPKTTRHRIGASLPPRTTPLSELLGPD